MFVWSQWKYWKELVPNNLSAVGRIFSSLHSRNYRLYFMGQCISLTGSWMQSIALSWLVYRLTGSVLLLATVAFVTQFPSFLLAPFAGVASDRFDKHKILIITQILFMLEALTLAALVLTNSIQTWHILTLGLYIGIVTAFDSPARQSLVIELVGPKDLSNAIALNSAIFNGARLIGPSVGGILISLVGEGYCFLINGISYIAVISALLMMRLPAFCKPPRQAAVLAQMREGIRYVWGFLPIRTLLLLIATLSFFGMPMLVIIPAYVKDILLGDSQTLGFLMSSFGAGALLAALSLAARKSVLGLGKILTICIIAFSLCLVALSFVRLPSLAYVLAFPCGFGLIVAIATINTLLQTLAANDKRGRVMSFYGMFLIGMAPLGSLLHSLIAKYLGLTGAMVTGAVVCLCAACVYEYYRPLIRKLSRPVYVEKGILVPEIAAGLPTENLR